MNIGDRHMRPVPGLASASETRALTVLIRVSEAMVRSPAGQMTLTCLVNLLCRQVGGVAAILLDCPTTPLVTRLPCDDLGGDVLVGAARIVGWATGGQVSAEAWDGRTPVDFTVLVGECEPPAAPGLVLACLGLGWRGWAGTPAIAPRVSEAELADPNPLGPFLAASFVAGEVFKRARKADRGRFIESFGYSLWSGETCLDWAELADGPGLEGQRLPAMYIVGAGAVGQGLAYILGSAPLEGFGVAIDDDRHDDTNLNRCFLAGAEDQDGRKVAVIDRFLASSGFCSKGFAQTLVDYLGDVHPDLLEPLADDEERGRFQVVVSCVDKGTSRQTIQGMWPRLIFGGSTEGFSAKTNLYDIEAGTACLGCHNPPEPDGERIRLLERQMRPLDRAQRAAFLADKVENLEAVLDYLEREAAGCGTAGEAQFRAAAVRHGGEFSVGFVSLGASLLLASALLRRLAFVEAAPARSMMATLNFLHVRAADGVLAVNPTCDRCGGDRAGSPSRLAL